MAQTVTLNSGSRQVRVISTDARDGDFSVALAGESFEQPRRAIIDKPWTWLNQVHGSELVIVDTPGQSAGAEADAAVTLTAGCPIAVNTADCAPLVMTSTSGVAVVHVGWRGAVAGVVGAAAEALTAGGAVAQASWLGPCIGPSAYEFGAAELDRLVKQFGDRVRATTAHGAAALDMYEVIAAACAQADWPIPERPECTSSEKFFSHRTRADKGRQTTVAWIL